MALSRPVAERVWAATTTTGNSTGIAGFGLPITQFSVHITNASTKAVSGTVQGNVGHSTGWHTIHTFTTSQTTGTSHINLSTGFTIDKARINLSANPTTGTLDIWIAGA